ncbi:MAG: YkgJ family cysteine cluster protein [Desulfobacteraceae bacterium]|nr:YkgJ family cysteine cluster protein [Desulfobacteraceae bacterium]
MTDKNDGVKKAEIPPVQLSYDSKFKFECHKGVKCFTDCCRGIDIMLTPYDILTMSKELELSSEEFLAIYTEPKMLEKAELPIVKLKLGEDDRKSCFFVDDENGCTIYSKRPTTCRYYPLGVGALSYSSNPETEKDGKKNDEFFFTIKESHCKGFEEEKEWTVREWREDQGIEIREELDDKWMDLIVRKKTLPPSMKLTEKSRELFFMVCYNLTQFKKFVFESSFLDRYDIKPEKIEKIKTDDVELMKFGFDWLKATMFSEDDGGFALKKK